MSVTTFTYRKGRTLAELTTNVQDAIDDDSLQPYGPAQFDAGEGLWVMQMIEGSPAGSAVGNYDTLDAAIDAVTAVETVTAANTISADESGKIFFLSSATEFASTLPAPAAGLRFAFIVAAAPSGASYTITTNSSANIIKGNVVTSEDAAADSETSGGDTISFVDGQAVAGDRVDVISDGTNWFAYGRSRVAAGITITTAS